MVVRLVVIGMALITLVGCAYSAAVLENSTMDAKAKQFHAPLTSGIIYFYAVDEVRNPLAPLGSPSMIVNGKQVGRVDTSTYLAVSVPPGEYVVSGISSNLYPVKVSAVGGDTHFVRFTYRWNSFVTDEVDAAVGRQDIQGRVLARSFPVVPNDQPLRVEIAK